MEMHLTGALQARDTDPPGGSGAACPQGPRLPRGRRCRLPTEHWAQLSIVQFHVGVCQALPPLLQEET